MTYKGVYINLDRSEDRRAAMGQQIARYGLGGQYQRMPAAAGNILDIPTSLSEGEIGCLTSHYLVWKRFADPECHLHIVEDDVQFSGVMHSAINEISASTIIDNYDVIFLDTTISPFRTGGMHFLRDALQNFDKAVTRDDRGAAVKVLRLRLSPYYQSGATSYLVNRRSAAKLVSMFEKSCSGTIAEPIDIMIRRRGAMGELRIGCIFPFLTSVRIGEIETTIPDRRRDHRSTLALDLLRYSFFVDRDLDRLAGLARRVFPPDPTNEHRQLVERMLGVYLDENFELA